MSGTEDPDLLVAKMERSARSVTRLSTATKVICGLMLVIALVMMLYALSRIDKRGGDDTIAFGLLSVLTTALALLFWSTAAFHAAFAQSTQVLAALHLNADLLVRIQQRPAKTPKTAHAEPAKPATPEVPAPALAAAAPPPAPIAEVPGAAVAVEPTPVLASENGAAAVSSPPPAAPAAAEEPDVPQKTCRSCKGSIRVEALRCKWCFERV